MCMSLVAYVVSLNMYLYPKLMGAVVNSATDSPLDLKSKYLFTLHSQFFIAGLHVVMAWFSQ